MYMRCARIVPRSSAVVGRPTRSLTVHTPSLEFSQSGAWLLPLLPHDAPQLSPQPLIQIFEDSFDLRLTEVRHPSPQVHGNCSAGRRKCSTPASSQQVTEFTLHPFDGIGSDLRFRSHVMSHPVPQKPAFPWSINRTLRAVDLQTEMTSRSRYRYSRRTPCETATPIPSHEWFRHVPSGSASASQRSLLSFVCA